MYTVVQLFIAGFQFLAGLMVIGMGLFVLKNGSQKQINRRYFTCMMVIGVWTFIGAWRTYGLAFYYLPKFSHNIALAIGSFIGSTMIHFITSFPSPLPKMKWVVRMMYIVSIYFSITLGLFFPPTRTTVLPFSAVPPPVYFGQFLIYNCIAFAFILYAMFLQYQKLSTEGKNRYKWLGISFVFALLIAIWCNVALPYIGVFNYFYIGRIAFSIVSIMTFTAIVKYEVFGIKTVVHHTFFWAILSTLITLPFIITILTLQPLFEAAALAKTPFPLVVTILLLMFAMMRFTTWIQPKLDRRFFRKKYQLNQELLKFSGLISQTHTLDALANHIKALFETILYTKNANLFLSTSKECQYTLWGSSETITISEPEQNRIKNKRLWRKTEHLPDGLNTAELLIAISIEDKLRAVITLSEKKNLKSYALEELHFVENVSQILSVFLNNILLFNELQKLQQELLESEKEKVRLEQSKSHTQSLANGIIHEVKNTHHAISGLVKLLLEKQLQNSDETLMVIGEQSLNLHLFSKNYLIQEMHKNQILDIQRKSCSVESILQNAIQTNYFFIKTNMLDVQNHTPADLQIQGDATLLHLLFSNILNNYAKYLPPKSILNIQHTHDNGLDIIFTPLIPHPTHAECHSNSGTGLGLKICESIMQLHQGHLNIQKGPTGWLTALSFKGAGNP